MQVRNEKKLIFFPGGGDFRESPAFRFPGFSAPERGADGDGISRIELRRNPGKAVPVLVTPGESIIL